MDYNTYETSLLKNDFLQNNLLVAFGESTKGFSKREKMYSAEKAINNMLYNNYLRKARRKNTPDKESTSYPKGSQIEKNVSRAKPKNERSNYNMVYIPEIPTSFYTEDGLTKALDYIFEQEPKLRKLARKSRFNRPNKKGVDTMVYKVDASYEDDSFSAELASELIRTLKNRGNLGAPNKSAEVQYDEFIKLKFFPVRLAGNFLADEEGNPPSSNVMSNVDIYKKKSYNESKDLSLYRFMQYTNLTFYNSGLNPVVGRYLAFYIAKNYGIHAFNIDDDTKFIPTVSGLMSPKEFIKAEVTRVKILADEELNITKGFSVQEFIDLMGLVNIRKPQWVDDKGREITLEEIKAGKRLRTNMIKLVVKSIKAFNREESEDVDPSQRRVFDIGKLPAAEPKEDSFKVPGKVNSATFKKNHHYLSDFYFHVWDEREERWVKVDMPSGFAYLSLKKKKVEDKEGVKTKRGGFAAINDFIQSLTYEHLKYLKDNDQMKRYNKESKRIQKYLADERDAFDEKMREVAVPVTRKKTTSHQSMLDKDIAKYKKKQKEESSKKKKGKKGTM